ncbi:hypothetical protein GCM10008171_32970 [Methylopila jiangsuensis]|uniref:Lipoprotein n=1 Tax=Methylopila jiangsuensis TaxID=586230 RepID=A0A9W6N564_9HYPH|nr:hypothetical protein [Methylopila jiangsuensis]MDR6284569.1 hypothetical protein [Methylopila jiangsuensis]GLK78043.1 hypothetical protein GCM10008171_32970 [Methylopila jiangsuensis]
MAAIRTALLALACAALAACSHTTPAAVRMTDGRLLTGTATAALSAGTFEVVDPASRLRCFGNYDQFSSSIELSAPVTCSDGRVGVIRLTRSPDLLSGSGTVTMTDGSVGNVAFGSLAASVIAPPVPVVAAIADPAPEPIPDAASIATWKSLDSPHADAGLASVPTPVAPSNAAYTPPSSYGGGGCYSGNYYGATSCITGRAKTQYVSGYYRKNGTYVRSYYRSRGRR